MSFHSWKILESAHTRSTERSRCEIVESQSLSACLHEMITANIAGSSGSHLRPNRDRDTDSDYNADLEEIERCKYINGGEISDQERQELEAESKRLRQLIQEHRRKKFLKDYKTWGYLCCVITVVILAIVLIILVGAGVISTDNWKHLKIGDDTPENLTANGAEKMDILLCGLNFPESFKRLCINQNLGFCNVFCVCLVL